MLWLIAGTFLFYSLNVTGFKIKGFVLVESCLKGEPIDMAFWAVYLAAVVTFWLWPAVGQWLVLGFLLLAAFTMFMTTVRFIIWPNENKTKRYNKYFAKTHHIIKPSERRLVPDTFHLILLALVAINLVALVVYIAN